MTKQFITKVDLRSRESMTAYLKNHFRYSTMNSWNGSSSYAHNVKLNRFVPHDLMDDAHNLVFADFADYRHEIQDVLNDFALEHDYRYQIGFNDRSSGYLVLYRGERKRSQHKSVCRSCWQRNFTSVKDTGTKCGKCGREERFDVELYDTATYPGQSLGDRDFDDLTLEELREEVKLVQSFDEAVQRCAEVFLNACQTCVVEEETFTVPQTRRVAHCAYASER